MPGCPDSQEYNVILPPYRSSLSERHAWILLIVPLGVNLSIFGNYFTIEFLIYRVLTSLRPVDLNWRRCTASYRVSPGGSWSKETIWGSHLFRVQGLMKSDFDEAFGCSSGILVIVSQRSSIRWLTGERKSFFTRCIAFYATTWRARKTNTLLRIEIPLTWNSTSTEIVDRTVLLVSENCTWTLVSSFSKFDFYVPSFVTQILRWIVRLNELITKIWIIFNLFEIFCNLKYHISFLITWMMGFYGNLNSTPIHG